MPHHAHRAPAPRTRFVPFVLAAGVAGAALLAGSATGTLSGFVASITNNADSAATGTLVMQEQNAGATVTCTSTDATTVSTNSATCSTINKFGGSSAMVPGAAVATTVSVKNTGTVAASTFTLAPGTCTQSNNGTVNGSATDLCTKMQLVIASGATTLYSGTLAGFVTNGSLSLGAQAAGASSNFTFTVTLPSTAGNTYQGLAAALPLTWTFNS
jgi:hypothetical protein